MAFIRHYAQQGDPFPKRTLRAGKLGHATGAFAFKRARTARMSPGFRRFVSAGGDPFRLRLPKFLKPPKFIRKAVSAVAKVALPLAGTLLPGIGGIAASLLGGGGGSAPPETFAPEPTGTPGEVAGGNRAFADYPRQMFSDEDAAVGPGDEDEDEDFEDLDTLSEDED